MKPHDCIWSILVTEMKIRNKTTVSAHQCSLHVAPFEAYFITQLLNWVTHVKPLQNYFWLGKSISSQSLRFPHDHIPSTNHQLQ